MAVYLRDNGVCQTCGNQIGPAGHCAHILPQDVQHLARYGEEIIHHILNQKWVCSLKCNAAQQINYDGHPVAAEAHATMIRAELGAEFLLEEGVW